MAIEVTVRDDAVDIDITGAADVLLCLSGGLRIPMADVVGARLLSWDEFRPELGWRVGGGYWPGLIATGWFTVPDRKGARQLLAVFRDRAEILVIDTKLDKPCRVVLQHPDRERLAWWINERIAQAA